MIMIVTNVTMISLEIKIKQQRPNNWHVVINLELNMLSFNQPMYILIEMRVLIFIVMFS